MKTFRYHMMSLLIAFGPAALGLGGMTLFIALVLVIKGGTAGWMLYAGAAVFGGQVLVHLGVILNYKKALVSIGPEGIGYSSPIRKLKFGWQEIAEIRKVYAGGWYGGPPRDLEIELQNGKQLKILHFILSTETEKWDQDGMAEFESLLKEYYIKRIVEP